MSIINSIRSQLAPIHPEGYPFIGGFALASLILFWLWTPLGWIGTLATAWCAYFFRDPSRVTPVREGLVVAPADGRVSQVVNAVPPPELGLGDRPLPRISIFMSVFDCHVNRSPVVRPHRAHRLSRRASSSTPISTRRARTTSATPSSSPPARARIGVVQIAGLIARRIVPLRAGGAGGRRRRAHRHDPLRLARRRLSAGGRPAAGGRRPDRDRRRDRAGRSAPRPTPAAAFRVADVNGGIGRRGDSARAQSRYIGAMTFSPFDPDRLAARRRRFRADSGAHAGAQLITLLALCAGLTAIRLAFEDKLEWALAAIVFAAALDGIDGRVARLLKGPSRFGAELDSLADFVNFGCAPALILYFWGLHDLGNVGWIAAMVFAICAALRLARFNVMIDDPNRPLWAGNFFTGVPAPAGAITVLLPIYRQPARRAAGRGAGHAALHARDRVPDGVAAAGVLRQARRQARAAGDGAAGVRAGGAVLRAADQLSVVGADASARSAISPACRSAGSPTASISARTRCARLPPRRPPMRRRPTRRRRSRRTTPSVPPGSTEASRPRIRSDRSCPAPPAFSRLPNGATRPSSTR